jgi:hypothetical protein
LDPVTQHGAAPAEQRCRYIFRYYTFKESFTYNDEIGSSTSTVPAGMNFEQFKELTRDINNAKQRNAALDADQLEVDALSGYKVFGLSNKADLLMLPDFLMGVGQLKFRGTSVLFRLSKSLSEVLASDTDQLLLGPSSFNNISTDTASRKQLQQMILPKTEPFNKRAAAVAGLAMPQAGAKGSDASSEYELATHTVKVKRTGALFDIAKLWDLEGATTPNISIDKTFNNFEFNRSMDKPQTFNRFQSVDFFNQQSQPNEMLR